MRASDEREAGLVLDVLDADALGAAQEDGERVLRVLDVVDLEAAPLRLVLDPVRVVHEQREVVQERAAAVRRAARARARTIGRRRGVAVLAALEAHVPEALAGRLGIISASTTWSRSKSRPSASTSPSGRPAGASKAATPSPCRATSNGSDSSAGVEVVHAQHDALERAALARALRVEQRQLAELGVDSDEREVVGLLDHVHAEVLAEEVGERLALVDPEGHMVQAGGGEVRWHGEAFTPGRTLPISATSSGDSSISAAARFSSRCSIDDVPGIGSITGERASSQASAIWSGRGVVRARDAVERAAGLGEPAGREREPGDEPDARLLAGLEHVLRVAVLEVVAVLDGHDLDDPARLARARRPTRSRRRRA